MIAIDYQTRLISRLPTVLQDSPWTGALVTACATILQRQDDDTSRMESLLRSLTPTGLTQDCIAYNGTSMGTVAVGQKLTGAAGSGVVSEIVSGNSVIGSARLTDIVGTFGRPELLAVSTWLGGVWVPSSYAVCTMDLYGDNAWLSGVGSLVGYTRGSESDAYCLTWMKAQIATNSSCGRLQDLHTIGDCLFGANNTRIDDGGEAQWLVDRVTPKVSAFGTSAAANVTVIVEAETTMTVSDADAARAKAMLMSAKPAGVKLYLGVSATPTGLGRVFQLNVTALGTTQTPSTWAPSTVYVAGDVVTHVANTYICLTGGTSGTTGPVGYVVDEVDGSAHWTYASSTFYSLSLI
jgi:hypothetical protein